MMRWRSWRLKNRNQGRRGISGGILALLALLLVGPARAGAETLSVALDDEDNRPYEFITPQGKPSGFHLELILSVAHRLGWQVDFASVPWNRAQVMLSSGDVKAVTYLAKTPERDAFAVFLPENVLHVMNITLYTSRQRLGEIRFSPPLSEMMRRWRFGATLGYAYREDIDAALREEGDAKDIAGTQGQLLAMLGLGRIDVAIVMDGEAAAERARATVPDLDARIAPVEGGRFRGAPVYLAFTRAGNGPDLASAFAKAYQEWRGDPAYRALATRFHVEDTLARQSAP